MLENESQLNITKYWIGHFTEAIDELEDRLAKGDKDPFLPYQILGLRSQRADLEDEVKEYESQHKAENISSAGQSSEQGPRAQE